MNAELSLAQQIATVREEISRMRTEHPIAAVTDINGTVYRRSLQDKAKDSLSIHDFVGDDTTTKLEKAIYAAEGRTITFPGGTIYDIDPLVVSGVPGIHLRSDHGATLRLSPDITVQQPAMLRIDSGESVILENLVFDCGLRAAQCVNILNEAALADGASREVRTFDCHFINGKQIDTTTDRAVGVRVQGEFSVVAAIGGRFHNFTSTSGDAPVSRGILCSRFVPTAGVHFLLVNGAMFSNIAPANDGDGIQFISADAPYNGIAIIINNYSSDCAKRFFKSQGPFALFALNHIYRSIPPLTDENAEGPGVEVAFLRGGGRAIFNQAYYKKGASPPMFVSFNTLIESPSAAFWNTLNCEDPSETMRYFASVNGEFPVQNGVEIVHNRVNFSLDYWARIRPDAQPTGGVYSVDRLSIDDNYAKTINYGLITLERSGSGSVDVRGSLTRNRHDGLVVPAVIFRYSNTAFDLTDFRDNENIDFFSQRTNTSDNSALTAEQWETLEQTLTVTATGGTFTATGHNTTTAALAHNISAAALQTAIRALGGKYAFAEVTGPVGGVYHITRTVGAPLLVLNTTSLTGGAATVTGYQYSGTLFRTDFRATQTLSYNRITKKIGATGDVRFEGSHRGNEAIVCVLEHSGKGAFYIQCFFHPGGGVAFGDNAACCNFRVQHGTTPQALQRLNSTYSGSWDVFDTGPNTIEIRKAAGTGSSSAEWWVDVVGTARPREG